MMRLLHTALRELDPTAVASYLFSDVGHEFYAGFKAPQGSSWQTQCCRGVELSPSHLAKEPSLTAFKLLEAELLDDKAWSEVDRLIEKDNELSLQELTPNTFFATVDRVQIQ